MFSKKCNYNIEKKKKRKAFFSKVIIIRKNIYIFKISRDLDRNVKFFKITFTLNFLYILYDNRPYKYIFKTSILYIFDCKKIIFC